MSERVQKVLANCEQGLSTPEKAQARRNIDAQASLTAGENIQIDPVTNTISAIAATYSAGNGISIESGTITNTAPNVQSDWNAAAGSDAEILNKPSIPTVYDGVLTIKQNGMNVTTFSANQSSAATANISVPTDTSELTNGAGFVTASQIPAQTQSNWNESDPTAASYIQNKPTIPAAQVNSDWNASSGVAQILNKPSLATVAISGSYNDLDDKPTIPGQVNSDWNASSGVAEILHKPILAPVATSGSYNDLTDTPTIPGQVQSNWNETDTTSAAYILNKPTIPAAQVNADWTASSGVAAILHKPSIPSATSDLTNDSGFVSATNAGNNMYLVTDGQGTPTWRQMPVQRAYFDNNGDLQYECANGIEIFEEENSPNRRVRLLGEGGGSSLSPSNKGYLVPAPDPGKVLTTNSNGSIVWSTPDAGVFVAWWSGYATGHDNTTYTAIKDAYDAGKAVFLKSTVAGGDIWRVLDTIDSSKAVFSRTSGANVSGNVTNSIVVVWAADDSYEQYGTQLQSALTAGSYLSITNSNNQTVIENTMHLDTAGLMVSYNTLSASGTTTHSFGPWRIELDKSAMLTWDTTDSSVRIKFAHSDYLDGSIINGRILVDSYYPWKDGSFTDSWTGHNQWSFVGNYTQGGSNLGFPIWLSSPMDDDSYARACPKSMRGFKFTVNCGINAPDWLECTVNPLYVNSDTTISNNAARLLLQIKYFYV